jgi:hypothetical protein
MLLSKIRRSLNFDQGEPGEDRLEELRTTCRQIYNALRKITRI